MTMSCPQTPSLSLTSISPAMPAMMGDPTGTPLLPLNTTTEGSAASEKKKLIDIIDAALSIMEDDLFDDFGMDDGFLPAQ
mmetsp:Transcript_14414/g.34898  ORF Transcript_14414/g.34898 Transcript_14414/m.34898 type:complete len:80 (+) Transcript_14414:321-560(+)